MDNEIEVGTMMAITLGLVIAWVLIEYVITPEVIIGYAEKL